MVLNGKKIQLAMQTHFNKSVIVLHFFLYQKRFVYLDEFFFPNNIKYMFGFNICFYEFPFFFFFLMHAFHCFRRHRALFMGPTTTLFRKKNLKMSLIALFTHLIIILLQYFQFLVFSKISCIQMDPKYQKIQLVVMFQNNVVNQHFKCLKLEF